LHSALRENTANALNETQCHSNTCDRGDHNLLDYCTFGVEAANDALKINAKDTASKYRSK